ncbi:MAG: alanyl-tRNA editing protein [Candidatus Aenigmarchaeota archaeon]|nr:alanyl-tRNA editing protein [Candidatus Aenigmarchaeota archaeon]
MKALYMDDSYLREFEAVVTKVSDGKYVVLDQTAFYPNSGGQPYDTGSITRLADGAAFRVVFVGKFGGDISHEVQAEGPYELKEGDAVRCSIDWERRYRLMRSHTAAHIISSVINAHTGALITGNQLNIDKSRIDFSLEDYDPGKMAGFVEEASEKAAAGADVHVSYITKDEAEKTEGLSKLAKGLPPGIDRIRIVDIEGIDRQADGGTHVKNTKEIGKIEFLKSENKGKSNRRLYYRLAE